MRGWLSLGAVAGLSATAPGCAVDQVCTRCVDTAIGDSTDASDHVDVGVPVDDASTDVLPEGLIQPSDATWDHGAEASAVDGGEGAMAIDGGIDAPDETGTGCVAPGIECGGQCVDGTQPTHCGACSKVCSGPEAGAGYGTCLNGECGVACDADGGTSLDCNGACVDPSSTAHCGSCTNPCAAPASGQGVATCAAPMTCGVSCRPGYHPCGSGVQADCLPDNDPASAAGVGGRDVCILSEAFGIFTSPLGNDTTGNGTRVKPYATIGHGMDVAATGTRRVYACASAGNYAENLTVGLARDGVTVYSALDCTVPAKWTYDASLSATVAPASGYALQVSGLAAGVRFEDVAFVAPSAPATAPASGPGASSIAVLVTGSSGVALVRGKIVSGNGQPGAPGVLSPYSFPTPTQLHGNPGSDTTGGAALPVLCPDGSTSTGGKGGDPPAGDGAPGLPSLGQGAGGTFLACNAGMGSGAGAVGAAGSPGGNAPALTMVGALSITSWLPAGGAAGSAGGPGQGGGGGGASVIAGAGGGGGGGAGGCGGAGGAGGAGGGASIAVVAVGAAGGLTLQGVVLVTGHAGVGGPGVAGQMGQAPGGIRGASPSSGGCNGGSGGAGGVGGAGAGGAGGSSVGVLYSGATPMVDSATQSAFLQGPDGSAGTGGAPGSNDGIAGAKGPLVSAP